MDFADKVVIITGAARGLGQAYAQQFASFGANVAVNDLKNCSETLALVEKEGPKGLVTKTDATGEVFQDKKDKIIEVTMSQQAIRRPLETDDIVGAVLYLASDHSKLTTGQTIMVDGGTVFL